MELADKLLEYKDRRDELLEKLNNLDSKWITYFRDTETDKWKFHDIDPFSVFAIFNNASLKKFEIRREIAQRFKDIFQLKSECPSDFVGTPLTHYEKSYFFDNKKEDIDLDPLWKLFELAINYPDDDSLISIFDKVLILDGIGWVNITMALFWIRPYDYITLDKHTREFLSSNGIQIKKTQFSGRSYLDLIKKIRNCSPLSQMRFPDISKAAFSSKHPLKEYKSNEENQELDTFIKSACNILRFKKNIILQGAPGTGKTYSTAEIALRILGVDIDFGNHKAVMEWYQELCDKGRIFFTTFHQSMDYEDFVEGLKPVILDESVGYGLEKGIFRIICDKARRLSNKRISKKIDFTKTRIFKMSLGEKGKDDVEVFEYCKENNVVALGWGENKDFSNCQTTEDIQKLYADEKDNRFGPMAMERFICWMRKGDIILVSDGNSAVKAIAKIVGDYEFHNDTPIGMCQFRKVEWLYLGDSIPLSKLYDINFMPQCIYAFYSSRREGTSQYNGSINTDMINKIITGEINTEKPLPYVLIIDEINRGNVSKIFGELVTLLEADKRSGGGDHPITVKLPYSKEEFCVPSNVYIIGTMNTTDRSTGTLDYAIRRRFAFVTLEAKSDYIPEGKARDLFKDIRSFIVKNHSSETDINDLMVGHSYFMLDKESPLLPDEQLKLKIEYEVVPLLKEYLNDGLLTCSQEDLNEHIEAWIKLETFKQDSNATTNSANSESETSQSNE